MEMEMVRSKKISILTPRIVGNLECATIETVQFLD